MLYRPLNLAGKVRPRKETVQSLRSGKRSPIVVALDGQVAAENSLPHAVELARHWEAPLHLMQVMLPTRYWDANESAVLFNSEWLSARQQAEVYLESVSEAISTATDIPVTAEITTNISVESELSSLSADTARLLVLAKPIRSGFSQVYLGSVTNSLVSQTRVPLLIVPTGCSDEHSENTDYRRILVCAGHGDVSENVLTAAAVFGADGAACQLLHVFPLSVQWAGVRASRFIPIDLRQDALARLHSAERWLNRQEVNATSQLVDDWRHSPAEAILAHADSFSADLIILGTRRRFLPWWLRGGLSEYITRRSKRPVLLVPQEESVSPLLKGNHVDFHSN